jgi:hypothetical protein
MLKRKYLFKTCAGPCGEEKEITNFGPRQTNRDGLSSLCRPCDNARSQTPEVRKRRRERHAEFPEKIILQHAKSRAKKKNIEFNLTKDDIKIPEKCPVLGIKIQKGDGYVKFDSPSLDRIDPTLGYIKDNIIIVSFKVNAIKNNVTIEEMELIVKNFYKTNNAPSTYLLYNVTPMFDRAKVRARIKNIEFNIKHEDVNIPKICPILGIEIFKGKDSSCDNSPSLDRIDNTKGYTKENIRVISQRANQSKNEASFEEYEKIYLFYKQLIYSKKEVIF